MEEPLEIPYAVRWLVPKGERFANFPLLNDNDTQLEWYRRFGHVYAVGIPTKKWRIVVVSDPELLDEVAENEEQFGKRVEEINFFAQLARSRGDGISVIGDGERYERIRRVMLPWYAPSHQRTQLERMKEQARRLVDAWAELPPDEPLDARAWLERYTLEVSGRGACNYGFGLLNGNGDGHAPPAFAAAVPESTKESIARVAEPRPDLKLLSRGLRRYRRHNRELYRTAETVVRGRMHTCPVGKQTDLLGRLLTTPDPETGELLDVETIRDQILMHLSNGFNGPSITGAWLAYVLATYPEVEEKVLAEIDGITGGDPDYDLRYEDLLRMPYVTQVIKETLRVYPPMPVTVRRSLKDGFLGRYRMRRGDIVFVGALAAQRDPRWWGPDPDAFDPDHFAPERAAGRPRHAFIPFSVGKRQCMAQEVTFMMLRVVLFEICRRYRLRLAPGATVEKNTVVTTKPKSVPVVLRPRERVRVERPAAAAAPAIVTSRDWGPPTEIPPESPYRRLVVAYGSNFGANKELAERFGERAEYQGFACDVVTLNELAASPPPNGDPWLLVAMSSTYTSNPPTNATAFKALLEHARPGAETWSACRYLVWGLGNSQWNAFLAFPRWLHEALERAGATPLADFAYGDVGSPLWEQAHAEWNAAVWPTLLDLAGAQFSEAAAERIAAERAEADELKDVASNTAMAKSLQAAAPRVLLVPTILSNAVGASTVPARAVEARELQASESPRRTRHLELRLPDGFAYAAGDHLGVCPRNPEERVERLAAHLGAELEGLFMVPKSLSVHVVPRGVVLQVRNVLTNLVDIAGPPTPALLDLLREKATDPADRARLEEIRDGRGEGRWDVLRLLDELPSCSLNLFELLQAAQPLRPRYYSPSSSPRVHGASVAHLTVGLDELGTSSRYLHGLREGDRVDVFLDGADGFHLQEDVSKPMLFVSAGTGFAPMLGFLWERLALRDAGARLGEAALFNGIRSPALDYVYREEIERFAAEGVLDHVHVATSREGERLYVQDLLRRESALVWRLLEAGGYVYVCGGQGLRDGVREAFVDVVAEHAALPREHAEAFMVELENTEQRYRPDLWA
ncbi:MAG TPA: cytochrome P450 [Gaiellaceae bacterium]|nr:cytochrome P450 [Gaiellaceae bacterium]